MPAQIVTFTFPHIGNVGANHEDLEADNPFALGSAVREDVTGPSNFRASQGFAEWMRSNGRIGLAGVDTRALTRKIRSKARQTASSPMRGRRVHVASLLAKARKAWPGPRGHGPRQRGVVPPDVSLGGWQMAPRPRL